MPAVLQTKATQEFTATVALDTLRRGFLASHSFFANTVALATNISL